MDVAEILAMDDGLSDGAGEDLATLELAADGRFYRSASWASVAYQQHIDFPGISAADFVARTIAGDVLAFFDRGCTPAPCLVPRTIAAC